MKTWLKKIGKTFNKSEETTYKKKEENINAKAATKFNKPEEKKQENSNNLKNLKLQKSNNDTKQNWLNKLGENFKKTSSNIKNAIFIKKLEQKNIENIEEAFLMSDLGVSYTNSLLEELNKFKTSASDKTFPLILNFRRVIT